MTDSLIDGPTTTTPVTATTTSGSTTTSETSESSDDPIASTFLFYVEIDGAIVGVFTECNGIGAKRMVETFREGGVNEAPHVLPGPIDFDHITLKRGVTASRALWNWFEACNFDGGAQRSDITIVQGAPGSTGLITIKTWDLKSAFPVSWKLSDLNTGSSTLVIETLELAHEGLTLQ
jgi:phage tail-like protein